MNRTMLFAAGVITGGLLCALLMPLYVQADVNDTARIAALETRLAALESGNPSQRQFTLNAQKKFTVTAGDEIVLTTGASALTMKKNGTIVLKGRDITIDGDAITVKGSGNMVLKGSKIGSN